MTRSVRYFLEYFNPRFRYLRTVIHDGDQVLDVGCGTGINAIVLHDYHPDVQIDGVDILPAAYVSPIVRYVRFDILKARLPYYDNTFDHVLFAHVIEHLPDPAFVLAEIRRVLKPGGTLYLETPSLHSLRAPSIKFHIEQGGPINYYDDETHIRVYASAEIEAVLLRAGFVASRCQTLRNVPKLLLDPLLFGLGFVMKRRHFIVNALWNMYGWAQFCLAKKPVH